MAEIALFDTHCHVDFHHFDEDRDAVFSRMREAGVTRAVAVAVELAQLPQLIALAEVREHVWFSVGVHPNHEVVREPDRDELIRLAAHPRCVAIGETGMDLFHHRVDPATQEERFRAHIRAAHVLTKPVIVHMRDADALTMKIMAEENIAACGGVMHCFSSSWDVAKQALDMGLSISFSGNVTFNRNTELRDVARMVPDDMLLVETDAPYLAPMPMRGKRNEPAFVRHVAECIAEVRGVSLATLAAQTTANAMRRFGIV